MLCILNCHIYDRQESSFDILIDQGKITRITRHIAVSPEWTLYNAKGATIIPGLIDLHVHGAGGGSVQPVNRDGLSTMAQSLARLGTTSFLATALYFPGKEDAFGQLASFQNISGANVLGLYLEGPFISPEKRGGIPPESVVAPDIKLLEKILEHTGDFLKMMVVAPELHGMKPIIRILKEQSIIPSLGHTNADYTEAMTGFQNGVSHVTHMCNCMDPLHHRSGGAPVAVFDSAATVEMICDGVHLHPGIVRMIYRNIGAERCVCITDGILAMGLPDGEYLYGGDPFISKEGCARFPDGTLIGTTLSLWQLAQRFKKFTECSFQTMIRTVTENPARTLGLEKQKGKVQKGYDADLLVLNEDLSIRDVFIAGGIFS